MTQMTKVVLAGGKKKAGLRPKLLDIRTDFLRVFDTSAASVRTELVDDKI